MTATYEKIATNTLSSAAISLTFSSIPATYTDLVLITSSQHAASDASSRLYLNFNSDTATNYSYTQIRGSGTAAFSSR